MFSLSCPLRWSDLDAQGHVNNAKAVDYLQEARVAFLRGGPASALLDSGVVVVGHQVEYRRSIEYLDEPVIDITLGVSALGAARIELAYEMFQAGEVKVRARTVLCPFDFRHQRPARLSPRHREFFAENRVVADPLRELTGQVGERFTKVPLTVRWSDLDSYGHVNNTMVFDYLQQARITATTQWAPEMARAGTTGSRHTWLIARQDVDYVKQLGHRMQPYEVRVAPVALGTSSITLASEIVDPVDKTVFNRARTVLVCADAQGLKSELPPPLRQRLLSLDDQALG